MMISYMIGCCLMMMMMMMMMMESDDRKTGLYHVLD